MKRFSALFILLVVMSVAARAQDVQPAGDTPVIPTATKLICPVTGENADPDVSYAYNGSTYYFCCNGCVATFKNNPEKYLASSANKHFDACGDHAGDHAGDHSGMHAKAGSVSTPAQTESDEAVINTGKDMSAQISNSVCPVMGKAVDKTVTTVSYKGKVYGFCCKSCIKKFAKDPEKYLEG